MAFSRQILVILSLVVLTIMPLTWHLRKQQSITILPLAWVWAATLIRTNSLIKGCSAARLIIVEILQALLSNNIVPMIPMGGNI
jgi:hypothetical protein